MSKEKVLDFEALALTSRKEAREQTLDQYKRFPNSDEFKDLSKIELNLLFDLDEWCYVNAAKKYSEHMIYMIDRHESIKITDPTYIESRYPGMYDKALFVLKGERYTTYSQGKLCALMGMSARHYRDVRDKESAGMDDDIISDMDTYILQVDSDTVLELEGLKRVIRELSLVGLSGVTEWSDDKATDKQKQAIESAIAGAQFISNSKAWADCNILEWYVSLNPDQRVKAGCKI